MVTCVRASVRALCKRVRVNAHTMVSYMHAHEVDKETFLLLYYFGSAIYNLYDREIER